LTPIQDIPSGGQTPRNFDMDPTAHWLLVTNHGSNTAMVFGIDQQTGKLTPAGQPGGRAVPFLPAVPGAVTIPNFTLRVFAFTPAPPAPSVERRVPPATGHPGAPDAHSTNSGPHAVRSRASAGLDTGLYATPTVMRPPFCVEGDWRCRNSAVTSQ
jgi:hypothetical protein